MLKIYNTLGRKLEEFKPIEDKNVGMYACGPTVYGYAHIGHGRKYVNDDYIKKALRYLGYNVKHIMNITDVGHLVSDGDEGEDKMEKGAKREGKTVWEIAEFYTTDFFEAMNSLNVEKPEITPKATDHIDGQIEMIEELFTKGYAYDSEEAVYFDVSKFPKYSELSGQTLSEKEVGVREEVVIDKNKRNPQDFVLWFKRVGKYKDHTMHWESPWGDGFPGWHIECSAMSTEYLGDQFDIHTGGEDHIAVHHTNEIAQSEGATGRHPFVNYWIHHAFLKVNNEKMGKSLGNYYTIRDVEEKGYDPIVLRYFYLTAHYRKTQNFTFEGLDAAKTAYERLINYLRTWSEEVKTEDKNNFKVNTEFKKKFTEALEDDFNIPAALAVVWDMTKSDIQTDDKIGTLLDFDRVLGLGLEDKMNQPKEVEYSEEVKKFIEERNKARDEKDYKKSDEIRDLLKEKFGVEVTDRK